MATTIYKTVNAIRKEFERCKPPSPLALVSMAKASLKKVTLEPSDSLRVIILIDRAITFLHSSGYTHFDSSEIVAQFLETLNDTGQYSLSIKHVRRGARGLYRD